MLAAQHADCCCRRFSVALSYALSVYAADMPHVCRPYAELSQCCPPLIHKLIHNLSTGYPIYASSHRNDATPGAFFRHRLSNVI
jgi:hypothetical protein